MKVATRKNGFFPSIFDDLFLENRIDTPNYENFSIPAINIQENLTNFVIQLAAPGLKKENFKIEVEKELLKVSYSSEKNSEKQSENSEENIRFTRQEFNFSSFKRSFTLPEIVDKEDIKASYEDGILNITLTKLEEKQDIKRMVEIS